MTDLAQTGGAALQLRSLSKTYGRSTVVQDVSLSIAQGEFVSFLGPSGSGKTTTLNMIAGFAQPTSGEIDLDGAPIAALPAHRRNIGMVFQHYGLFPHMTVATNVAFALRQRKVPRRQAAERVRTALELVQLEGLDDRYPGELSGGQQQRVALARAMVFDPRVLLMDEPLGALDRKLRDAMQIEIKRIHQQVGMTFVYVTHDQEEALSLSDRIVVFNDGRVEQVGTPEELYVAPRTLFVAGFVGESNLLDGTVETAGPSLVLGATEGTVHATVPAPGAAGSSCTVVVRPENVAVAPIDGPTPAANGFRGRLTQTMFLGPVRRMEVTLEGGRTMIARTPRGSGGAEIAVGDEVWASWAPASTIVPVHQEQA